jgi:eukaryotic-like serine/threonine-protein kinase
LKETENQVALLLLKEMFMKNKMIFPVVITLIVSLACQSSGQQPADPTETPVSPVDLESEITDEFGVPMALVPEGEFLMGGDAEEALAECSKSTSDCQLDWFTNAEPPHQVYLDAFYMDIYEVTNVRYAACVEAGDCTSPIKSTSYTRSSYYGDSQYDNYPVVHVDWDQARTYCKWRGGNLPTEAQWEKAARGTDGRTYPWGEGISCDQANYSGCKGSTTEVGSYESGKSPYGMYNMADNVWEWVNDWYDENYYASSPYSNPLGPNSGQDRVVRGGSWSSSEEALRTSSRDWLPPGNASGSFGFRCVRSLP